MKTPDEWASDLDKMYEVSHPSAEKFVRNIITSIYEDMVDIIENEHIYDDGVADLIRDRMCETLGEEI